MPNLLPKHTWEESGFEAEVSVYFIVFFLQFSQLSPYCHSNYNNFLSIVILEQ